MTELDRLKEAFDAERIAPRAGAREAAVDAALAAFDANNRTPRQGSGLVSRLRNAAHAASEILTGKRPMTQISMRHALAGGVSLAVLTLAVMTAANLQTIEGFRLARDARADRRAAGRASTRKCADADKPERSTDADKPTRAAHDRRRRAEAQGRGARATRRRADVAAVAARPPASRGGRVGNSVAWHVPATGGKLRPRWRRAAPPLADMAALGRAVRCGADDLRATAAGAMIAAEPMPQPGYHDQGRDQFRDDRDQPAER